MVDASEVGKYGTIRLLKRREPSTIVASYPVDDDEITFGRDPNCSIRLYYQWVSSLHCKISFEERKAFLQVFGANGVIVDGCPVYPARSTMLAGTPTTVPLPNGSTLEIHKKRFLFNYPPKELRSQLFTPGANVKRRGNLRMSMVNSAQVFSPAPSSNPCENLRVLQSPLKLSTLAEDLPITLVNGNHPRVFEEEQDLVILEDVEIRPVAELQTPTPTRSQTMLAFPQAQTPQPQLPPRTPRRLSAPSLHRAVLIRSAQRVAYMQETQKKRQQIDYGNQFEEINLDEDAEEEEEVEEFVNSDMVVPDKSEEDMANAVADAGGYEEMILDGVEYAEHEMEEDKGENEQDITEARDDYQDEGDEDRTTSSNEFSTPLQVYRTRQLGAFMTPQPGLLALRPIKEEREGEKQRIGPQRPPPGYRFSLAPGLGAGTMSLREENAEDREGVRTARSTSPTKIRPEITAEERKAILERRKSALKLPDPEFADHIPGLGSRRTSALPPPGPAVPASPFKSIKEDIEEGEDTHSVLKRMEESLAGLRSNSLARRSFGVGRGAGLPPSPEKSFSLLAPSVSPSPARRKARRVEGRVLKFNDDVIMEETGSQLKKEEEVDAMDAHADATEGDNVNMIYMEDEEEEHDENVHPHIPCHPLLSGTPRMDGLREMFHRPQAPRGLETPAIRGVRELFRERTQEIALQTPLMDGMRALFTQRRVPGTPSYDGIDEMMHLEEGDVPQEKSGEGREEGHNMPVDVPEDLVDDDQPKARKVRAPKTVMRSTMHRPVKGTPTDTSTMADDEATPGLETASAPKRRTAVRGTPEAAVVHRASRVRRTAGVDSDVEESSKSKAVVTSAATVGRKAVKSADDDTVETKAAVRHGRSLKAKAGPTDSEEAEHDAPTTKPKSRGRPRKTDTSVTASETEAEATASKPTRRGARAAAVQPGNETAGTFASAPRAVRRGTRARSRSADLEGETNAHSDAHTNDDANDDPLGSIGKSSPEGTSSSSSAIVKAKRGTRAKAAMVETIPEEEELASTQTLRKTGAAAAARARKTRAEARASHDDKELSKNKASTSRKPVAKALEATDDDDSTSVCRENKENTPERSLISPTESAEDVPVKAARSRVASKSTAATRTTASRTMKPSSRTTAKVKMEAEPPVAPRTMRTRAKK